MEVFFIVLFFVIVSAIKSGTKNNNKELEREISTLTRGIKRVKEKSNDNEIDELTKLEKLHSLYEKGVFTKGQYEERKVKLMDSYNKEKVVKIPCSVCNTLILPRTAEKTGGKCMPCYKKKGEFLFQKEKLFSSQDDSVKKKNILNVNHDSLVNKYGITLSGSSAEVVYNKNGKYQSAEEVFGKLKENSNRYGYTTVKIKDSYINLNDLNIDMIKKLKIRLPNI